MEIIIEIGTEAEKELINQEIEFLIPAFENFDHPPLNLQKIIVASDFEAKVREFEGNDNYRAVRGFGSTTINAMAKIANLGESYAIVISSLAYKNDQDTQTRFFILLHELSHIINKGIFPQISDESFVKGQYLQNLYNLFDEYSSDWFAYTVVKQIFPSDSGIWNSFVHNEVVGFLELINDPKYYNHIRDEIEAFRTSANLDLFFENTRRYFDEMANTLVHLFSLFHHYPEKLSIAELEKSPFVNEKTFALMNYFKSKREKKNYDLFDGEKLIIDFMTNFGVRFEHREHAGYCHVLDI